MDISKASNFERYVFDLVDRDGVRVKELWRRVDAQGEFDIANSAYFRRVPDTGFVSGRSTDADRLATIREVSEKHGVVIDPHTADGVKVGLEHREPGRRCTQSFRADRRAQLVDILPHRHEPTECIWSANRAQAPAIHLQI
jgi:threonine synthase